VTVRAFRGSSCCLTKPQFILFAVTSLYRCHA
jgi:hypothetical protein